MLKMITLLLKDVKDDINKWKDIPCSWIARFHVVKMQISPKVTSRVSTVPVNIPMTFLVERGKALRFMYNLKLPRSGQNHPEKERGS